MKRNKLILVSGILLVILASFSIIETIAVVEDFITEISLLASPEYDASGIAEVLAFVIYVGMIVIYLAQSIVYMIFGIKLIKKSKLPNAFACSRTILIVMLVLVCCSIFVDIIGIFSAIYIATVVLIICAIANGNRLDVENLEYLKNQMNQDTTIVTGKTSENLNNSNEKVTEETKEEVSKSNSETKTNSDLMIEKMMAIKNLKDSGVLSDEEFDNICKLFVSEQVTKTDNIKSKKSVGSKTAKKTSKKKEDKE